MSSATLNIRMSPRRLLKPRDAAEYCGMTVKRFPSECRVSPIAMPSGDKLYDIRDLDSWIDGMKSGATDSDDDIIGKLG